jgi:hypothetical protein
MRWYRMLKVFYDVDAITVGALSSEETIYDVQGTVYLGGGHSHDGIPDTTGRNRTPFYSLEIGGEDHWLFLANNPDYEKLHINLDPDNITEPVIWVSSAAPENFSYRAPWAVEMRRVSQGVDLDTVSGLVGLGGAIRPSRQRLTNPSFDSNTTGWTATALTGTASLSRSGATYYGSVAGSGDVNVTANAVTDGSTIVELLGPVFLVQAGEPLELSGAVRTATANLRPRIWIRYYTDTAGTAAIAGDAEDVWNFVLSSGTWYPRVTSAYVPATAVSARVLGVIQSHAASTGHVYFDDFWLGGEALYYLDERETDMGSTEIAVAFNRGWIG